MTIKSQKRFYRMQVPQQLFQFLYISSCKTCKSLWRFFINVSRYCYLIGIFNMIFHRGKNIDVLVLFSSAEIQEMDRFLENGEQSLVNRSLLFAQMYKVNF